MGYDYDNRTAAKKKEELLVSSKERDSILKLLTEAHWQLKELWIRSDKDPHKGTPRAKKIDEAYAELQKLSDKIRSL